MRREKIDIGWRSAAQKQTKRALKAEAENAALRKRVEELKEVLQPLAAKVVPDELGGTSDRLTIPGSMAIEAKAALEDK